MDILKYDELEQGGFAGLLEKRFVMDSKVFSRPQPGNHVNGMKNFVYLADANFNPYGETGMHPHREVDVISVMVDGEISHQGSLEHGSNLQSGQVQVQRAGGQGFTHNEINPNASINQMIQLWVLPDNKGELAGYKSYQPEQGGELTKIYGGNSGSADTFDSNTSIYVANAGPGQEFNFPGNAMMYLSKGQAEVNNNQLEARTLVRVDDGLAIKTSSAAQIIIIS